MASIAQTIADLQRLRFGGVAETSSPATGSLVALPPAGLNPGALRGFVHVPADLPDGAPLVVVLHGCTQTAESYERGAGWSALADRFGFAVLFPEQQRANNPNLCFNWFSPVDTTRGGGEAESIREMIAAVIEHHAIDRSRVFVTGLSAGGGMTSVMLATYPELFAGGAIVAGLPFGAASNVSQALQRMRGAGYDRATLGERVLAASPHRGPWPAVSVWHGSADATVAVANAAMIVDQWRGVHGVDRPEMVADGGGHTHRVWHDATGRAVIEEFIVAGLGHGTPITGVGDEACGAPGPHIIEAGISSTYRIAAGWGIVPATAPARPSADEHRPAAVAPGIAALGRYDPGKTIGDALRAAGLMAP